MLTHADGNVFGFVRKLLDKPKIWPDNETREKVEDRKIVTVVVVAVSSPLPPPYIHHMNIQR